jgi:hypothetical protein
MEESKHVHERQLSIGAKGMAKDRLLRPSGGVRSARLIFTHRASGWTFSWYCARCGAMGLVPYPQHIGWLANRGISSGCSRAQSCALIGRVLAVQTAKPREKGEVVRGSVIVSLVRLGGNQGNAEPA